MTSLDQSCLYCELNSNQVPLINFSYQVKELWICPQHLPILIHEPQNLPASCPEQKIYRLRKVTTIIRFRPQHNKWTIFVGIDIHNVLCDT